jgi:uncharacterized protein (TIGR00299 family) protein
MKSLRGLHLHLDPVSGIAGDMTVGALVGAGVPAAVVSDAIAGVGVRGLRVRFESRRRGAYVGRGFVVEDARSQRGRGGRSSKTAGRRSRQGQNHVHGHAHGEHEHVHGEHEHEHVHEHEHEHEHDHAQDHDHDHDRIKVQANSGPHRDYAEIRRLLRRAKLDPDAKALAEEIFARLAEVEAALHGSSLARVTFHEVGALDSIADIVGVSAAIAWLAPVSIGSSPPVLGTGTVETAHGPVPVPAPATAELLRGIPVIFEGPGELTTPTGAAFLATVVDSFGAPPPMRLVAVGYGAGTRVISDRANVLRVMLGDPLGRLLAAAASEVLVLETNIDDMGGQLLAALFEALFAAGALDVWSTPIVMKKGRPAQQVSALVEPAGLKDVQQAFFLHSTTLGIRIFPATRATLSRSMKDVRTPYGSIGIKIAAFDGAAIGAEPEYEDCRRVAIAAGVPIRRVWTAAVAASAALMPLPPALPRAKKRRTVRTTKRRRA